MPPPIRSSPGVLPGPSRATAPRRCPPRHKKTSRRYGGRPSQTTTQSLDQQCTGRPKQGRCARFKKSAQAEVRCARLKKRTGRSPLCAVKKSAQAEVRCARLKKAHRPKSVVRGLKKRTGRSPLCAVKKSPQAEVRCARLKKAHRPRRPGTKGQGTRPSRRAEASPLCAVPQK
jgi:hypothetical protein